MTFSHKNHKKSNDGMHLKLKIVSDDFKNISLIDRHRKIYKIVGKFLRKEIHALSISSYTILEYKKKSQ